jgi:hypothetical protein
MADVSVIHPAALSHHAVVEGADCAAARARDGAQAPPVREAGYASFLLSETDERLGNSPCTSSAPSGHGPRNSVHGRSWLGRNGTLPITLHCPPYTHEHER